MCVCLGLMYVFCKIFLERSWRCFGHVCAQCTYFGTFVFCCVFLVSGNVVVWFAFVVSFGVFAFRQYVYWIHMLWYFFPLCLLPFE